jgi:DNA-binding NarL/FixJ family response regulator
MSNIKVLLISDDNISSNKIKQYFSSHAVIEVRDAVNNGDDDLTLVLKSSKPPDNLVVDNYLEVTITKLLHELGVPSHIKGYTFIKEGISLIYNNPNLSITKELYPKIALKYNTNSYCVERAIRHAIEISWNRGNIDIIEDIFGYSIDIEKAKATNREYLITLADKLRIDYYL